MVGFSASVTADLNLIAIGIEKVNRSCLSARAPARNRTLANGNLICLEIFEDTSKVVRLDDQAKVIQVAVDFFANGVTVERLSREEIDNCRVVDANRREAHFPLFK